MSVEIMYWITSSGVQSSVGDHLVSNDIIRSGSRFAYYYIYFPKVGKWRSATLHNDAITRHIPIEVPAEILATHLLTYYR